MLERLADRAKDGAYFDAQGLTIFERSAFPADNAALTHSPSMPQKLGLISRENPQPDRV
jgi:hypothetical protein